jgi:hypothetical protein
VGFHLLPTKPFSVEVLLPIMHSDISLWFREWLQREL